MLEIFFPDKCSACKSISHNKLCGKCISQLEFLDEADFCYSCGEPFRHIDQSPDKKNYCIRCLRREFYFNRARSVVFHRGIIKELLHQFKYRDKLILVKTLSKLLTERFPADFSSFDLVLPVPLHIKKLRSREFNQSVLIAKSVSRKFICDFDPFNLIKTRENRPQFEMGSIKERENNVRGIFELRKKEKIRGVSVLLVDDVFTTGATVNECSRVLSEAGASEIQVLTLTRAAY